MLNKKELMEKTVEDFIFTVFYRLSTKKKKTIVAIILGIIRSKSLSSSEIGRAMAELFGTTDQGGINRVNKFLRNDSISAEILMVEWTRYLLKDLDEIRIIIDWTEFDPSNHSTFSISLLGNNNRSTPLLWRTVFKDQRKNQMNNTEDDLIFLFSEIIDELSISKVTVIADRGFVDTAFMKHLRDNFGFDFIIRIRSNILIKDGDSELIQAKYHAPEDGSTKIIKNGHITEKLFAVETIVISEERRQSNNSKYGYFCLASNIEDEKAAIDLYHGRFSCEETFRDIKNDRFGLGLSSFKTKIPERRDRMLSLGSIAIFIMEILAESAEQAGLSEHKSQETERKYRRFSLRNAGIRIYRKLESISIVVLNQILSILKERFIKPIQNLKNQELHYSRTLVQGRPCETG